MPGALLNIFTTFLRLGCTSFGGPAAHLGFFRTEFVSHKKWLTDDEYSELVAVSQFLPGPASSQVGMAIGAVRGGLAGGVAAWVGFTAPSAIIMIALALGVGSMDLAGWAPVIHALKLVAVAVVAQAVWGMAKNLCAGKWKTTAMIAMTVLSLLTTGPFITVAGLALAAVIAVIVAKQQPHADEESATAEKAPETPAAFTPKSLWPAGAFLLGLAGLPLLQLLAPGTLAQLTDVFYRTGALVFGGGHVVLPMLHNEVVAPGTVSESDFLAGYAVAQALPGPLFAFAAYVGAIAPGGLPPVIAGLVALIAVFLPGALILAGLWPLWARIKHNRLAKAAIAAVNAAVVGVLLAVLYDPLFTTSVLGPWDFAAVVVLLGALMAWRLPPWLVVLGAAGIGYLTSLI